MLGDADGRGVRAMRRAEGVVHVDVRVRRERRRERRVVGFLFRVEAQVLEQDDLARPHPLQRVLRADAQGIAGDGNIPPDQLGQRWPTGRSLRLSDTLPLGLPRWLARMTRGGLDEQADGRDRRTDPRVVLHLPVGDRDVEVDPHEDALPGDIRIADGELVHVDDRLGRGQAAATGRRAPTKAIRSATRQL